MRGQAHRVAGLYVAGLVWLALPGQGQVVPVQESGRRVFINEEAGRGRAKQAPASRTSRGGPALRPVAARSPAAMPRPAGTTLSKEAMQEMAGAAAERHEIDPALVHAIIETESNWNPAAISSRGARGLMQLMPTTAKELGVKDIFDPEQNLEGGVRYLRALLERFNGDLDKSLAAYNAGGGAVERAGGVPNYAETRGYVQRIMDAYFRPGSGRLPAWWQTRRNVYRMVDDKGRLVFTNE